VVSVRPLHPARQDRSARPAVAIVFIRDPLDRDSGDVQLLRELFGFTNAEAGLALALRRGVSPGEYGRRQQISQNTVYTNLRRIKEKTGCRRLHELIGRLNEVRMLLRRGWRDSAPSKPAPTATKTGKPCVSPKRPTRAATSCLI
jgi:DNA-binding CsgD family transcriptional regulator